MLLLLVAALAASAPAAEAGMTLTVWAGEGSRSVHVSGETSRMRDVTVVVVSPSGALVDAYQATPGPGGGFEKEFRISELWREDGVYYVRASQGAPLYSAEAGVRVSDGRAHQTEEARSTFERAAEPREPGGALELRADGEPGSDLVEVSGTAATLDLPVRVEVRGPDGRVVAAASLEPLADGSFSAPLQTGGRLWEKDGLYTVSASQGPREASARIEISGGLVVPEFGSAAALAAAGFAAAVAAGRRLGRARGPASPAGSGGASGGSHRII